MQNFLEMLDSDPDAYIMKRTHEQFQRAVISSHQKRWRLLFELGTFSRRFSKKYIAVFDQKIFRLTFNCNLIVIGIQKPVWIRACMHQKDCLVTVYLLILTDKLTLQIPREILEFQQYHPQSTR